MTTDAFCTECITLTALSSVMLGTLQETSDEKSANVMCFTGDLERCLPFLLRLYRSK